MDRDFVVSQFTRYVQGFDQKEEGVRLKYAHSLRVSGLCEQIALSLDLSQADVICMAIDQHNVYQLRRDLTPRQQLFCQLIRDVDKIDIFRVYVMYMRQKKNIWNVDWSDFENQPISDVVMAQARQGKLVRTQDKKTFMDFYVGALCFYFDLVYPKSRQLAREQGYLDRLLDFHSQNVDSEGKLDEIRRLVRGTGTLPQPSFTGTIYKNM